MIGYYLAQWLTARDKMAINKLRPRQNGRRFADDVFKCIFLNENVWILITISLKFISIVPVNNIPALVRVMAWRRSGDKPLSEPMMARLPTHICVTRPQWVKSLSDCSTDPRSIWTRWRMCTLSNLWTCFSYFCHKWHRTIILIIHMLCLISPAEW